tara:strand:- start:227 stop:520 length:294 start_codon:yes stop_codon:yes gene_type:complete
MKNMKRALRRHHYDRLKKKWKKKLRNDWFWTPESINDDLITRWVGSYTRTQTVCSSCLGCINPRKYESVTLQEQCNMLSFEEQMNEYYNDEKETTNS